MYLNLHFMNAAAIPHRKRKRYTIKLQLMYSNSQKRALTRIRQKWTGRVDNGLKRYLKISFKKNQKWKVFKLWIFDFYIYRNPLYCNKRPLEQAFKNLITARAINRSFTVSVIVSLHTLYLVMWILLKSPEKLMWLAVYHI